MDAIVLDGINKNFNSFKAVDSLSAVVPAGSVYGFLGPNGAGKTTTIRMIMNIITPDSGNISIFGKNSVKNLRSTIGYMPEERGLYKKMSVTELLSYFASIKGMKPQQIKQKIPYWLEKVALAEHANKKVEQLSRGMHQKLQFLVTVINDPDLIIFDEPFSGLDPVNLQLLKDIIVDLSKNGKTIIFSTHIMHEAESICDNILLINKGKIVLDGPLYQIKNSYCDGTVIANFEGSDDFLNNSPLLLDTQKQPDGYKFTLADGVNSQQFLKLLVDNVTVQKFEIKKPSLHEIFIREVSKDV